MKTNNENIINEISSSSPYRGKSDGGLSSSPVGGGQVGATWLVAHTRPQWEMIVCKQLKDWYHIEYYCPLQKIKRQYADRIKHLEKPIFKSYVFVQPKNHIEQTKVLSLDGVVQYVRLEKKPAIIRPDEMISLKNFIDKHHSIALVDIGSTVIVNKGALVGMEGIVTEIKNNKVVLELPSVGFRLIAEMDEVMATA